MQLRQFGIHPFETPVNALQNAWQGTITVKAVAVRLAR